MCQSNSGAARISPGPPIYVGEHWIVEHAYPTALLGWLVIVLRRHAEAFHALTRDECVELGLLQGAVAKTLAAQTGCIKEYSAFFAEMPEFHHVHVHMVPRAEGLSPELRGGRVFSLLQATGDTVVSRERVAEFCALASADISDRLTG